MRRNSRHVAEWNPRPSPSCARSAWDSEIRGEETWRTSHQMGLCAHLRLLSARSRPTRTHVFRECQSNRISIFLLGNKAICSFNFKLMFLSFLVVAAHSGHATLPTGTPPTATYFCNVTLALVVTQLIRKIGITQNYILC